MSDQDDQTTSPLHGFVDYRTVAKRLGVHPETVLRRANEPGTTFPPLLRMGTKRYLEEAAVADWLRSQTDREHSPAGESEASE